MSSATSAPIIRAIEALKAKDRRSAAALLIQEITGAEVSADRLRSVAQLAGTIGEIKTEIEAMRLASQVPPANLEKVLAYCNVLVKYNRTDEAEAVIEGLPPEFLNHPAVQHFLGTLATQLGEFAKAEDLFRRVLAKTPNSAQTWYTLSVIKTFDRNDPDIALMETVRPAIAHAMPDSLPQFLYALGKAYDDAGEPDKAATVYGEGAKQKRAREVFDRLETADFADRVVADYTPGVLAALKPSGCDSERVIFVNGLPRSGTTLVEQILTSHSAIHDGAEINLMREALIPAGSLSALDALNYQIDDTKHSDPWGEIGRDYLDMVTQRFGPLGRIVDKTLNHSRFMGLLLHCLPKAKVIWVRRNADDCALSCYRTFFATGLPWTWSLTDIAGYFRSEDALYEHWVRLFPDRILTVPYEALVSAPDIWTKEIFEHLGLALEPQVFVPQQQRRSVMTASVAQVREAISTSRIGTADAYGHMMAEFRTAYYDASN